MTTILEDRGVLWCAGREDCAVCERVPVLRWVAWSDWMIPAVDVVDGRDEFSGPEDSSSLSSSGTGGSCAFDGSGSTTDFASTEYDRLWWATDRPRDGENMGALFADVSLSVALSRSLGKCDVRAVADTGVRSDYTDRHHSSNLATGLCLRALVVPWYLLCPVQACFPPRARVLGHCRGRHFLGRAAVHRGVEFAGVLPLPPTYRIPLDGRVKGSTFRSCTQG